MKHNGYIHSAGTEAARDAIAQHFGSPAAPLTRDVRCLPMAWAIVILPGMY